MNIRLLSTTTTLLTSLLYSSVLFAAHPAVGRWQAIDSRSGSIKAIIDIEEESDSTYSGTVVKFIDEKLNQNNLCSKCPEPYHNKPIMGMKVIWGLKTTAKNDELVQGYALDPDTGKIYRGKAKLSPDGRRLKMRGYVGTSVLGRTEVWIKAKDQGRAE